MKNKNKGTAQKQESFLSWLCLFFISILLFQMRSFYSDFSLLLLLIAYFSRIITRNSFEQQHVKCECGVVDEKNKKHHHKLFIFKKRSIEKKL
jgi:hypothetical protein